MAAPRLALALLAFALVPAGPARADSYAEAAAEAAAARAGNVTVFVDVILGMRKDGAAKALSRAHAAFNSAGYRVADVTAYTENGDLNGFFVTYERRGGD